MKALLKMFKWILGTLFAVLLLAVGAIGVLIALEVRLQLDPLRAPVEAAAEAALGREVDFAGDMVLVPTLWPTLEVADVTIGEPPEWPEGDFASAGTVRLQLGIMPLFSGEIQIADITAKNVALNLVSNADGDPNWKFEPAAADAPMPDAKEDPVRPDTPAESEGPSIRFTALHNLTLEQIELSYADEQLGKQLTFTLERLQGAITESKPIEFELSGVLHGEPFQLDLEAGSLIQLSQRQEPWPLSLSGALSGSPLSAQGSYAPGAQPELRAALNLGRIDFGALLAWLGIMEGLEATADAVTVSATIRGDSLSELIADSEMAFSLEGGAWTLEHPGTGSRLALGIAKGSISVQPNEPVTVTLETSIDQVPLALEIKAPALAELLIPDTTVPIELAVSGGGANLSLTTEIVRPLKGQPLAFAMRLHGSRLDAMNGLLKADLPPFGPYGLQGELGLSQEGYRIQGLQITVAETRLNGDLSLDVAARPPTLDVALQSPRIQLDDFALEGWSPTKGAQVDTAPVEGAEEAETPPGESPPLLSRETLGSLDAEVSIAVDEVLYGPESLGRGSLLLTIEDGRLSLDPLEVDLPGGGAEARFLFHPQESDTEIALTAKVDEFDYGVLARRMDSESKVAGKLALDLDISAVAASPEQLLLKGEGHFDFGLWPGQLKADIFELWAVNVVSALMSEMDKDGTSKVNCVIARFRLKDGVMNDRIVFADTTKMRIEGSASVDFHQRTFSVQAAPKGKRPEFFSLAVPVGLSGRFDDFGIDINPVVLTTKAVAFATSPLHVPLRRIFADGEPADGEEACRAVWGEHTGDAVDGEQVDVDDNQGARTVASDEESRQGQPLGLDLREHFQRFRDRVEEAIETSPNQDAGIDVLNLDN